MTKVEIEARKDKKLKEKQWWYITGFAMGFLFFGIFFYNTFLSLFVSKNYAVTMFYLIVSCGLMISIWIFACKLDEFSKRVVFRERFLKRVQARPPAQSVGPVPRAAGREESDRYRLQGRRAQGEAML
ncbi:MAG: hypothetical protein HWN68_09590 [Desulfobacterales bacterium]|nr:hypothetical protein [Desulfobacterales bacterium]